jgi:tryptophanyl-tRNA synthetase
MSFKGQKQYGDFKKTLADLVGEFLRVFQDKLASVDEEILINKLESSENSMNLIANAKLEKVQKAVGLRKA